MKKIIQWIMLIHFSCFTILIAPNYGLAQDSKPQIQTIAVLTLEAKGGINGNEAATLTDRLRSELVNLGQFTVVERGRMNEILKEQGFSMTGCTSSECAIEAGRLLGVQQMLTGAVGKIGDILTVDIRIFDVTTGEIIKALQYDHEGDISGLLRVMRSVAKQLVTGQTDEADKKKDGFPWLWVGAGAVVVAGVVVALLGGDSGDSGTSSLPSPDWPPQ